MNLYEAMEHLVRSYGDLLFFSVLQLVDDLQKLIRVFNRNEDPSPAWKEWYHGNAHTIKELIDLLEQEYADWERTKDDSSLTSLVSDLEATCSTVAEEGAKVEIIAYAPYNDGELTEEESHTIFESVEMGLHIPVEEFKKRLYFLRQFRELAEEIEDQELKR